MNYLGHLFLSGTDPLVTVGNFMADAVKGRDLSRFDPRIEQGIRLHRAIDTFTDGSAIQRVGRARAHAHAGRYASVVMDMFYDHLLAANWSSFHPEPLPEFAARMYELLLAHEAMLPERTQRMLPYMVAGDWLCTYATLEGLGRAIAGLARRVPKGMAMVGAERVLEEHMEAYTAEFRLFLPAIEEVVSPLR
jgi:acyl carrier protein phosphodiesterase